MPILKLLDSSKKAFSFEIFPPKTPQGETTLYKNLTELQKLNPAFISVTMGAMGSAHGKTFEIVQKINEEYQIPGVAHLTCVNASRHQILDWASELQKMNIQNLLCLRGDPAVGAQQFTPPPDGFRYASELVSFLRKETGNAFTIGVAGYPEGHIECADKQKDLEHLKMKVDAGADYILTQLFFNNHDYFDFLDRARNIGIQIPIIPGIMPVTNFVQLEKFTQMCGAKIPMLMRQALEKIKDDSQALKNFGVEYAARQCEGLLKNNISQIHFYVLNQAESVKKVFQQLKF